MAEHYRAKPEIRALFLVGSVTTGTARENSDIDGVAIVSQAELDRQKQNEGTLEVVHGKCTYDFPKDHNTVMNKFADMWEWK